MSPAPAGDIICCYCFYLVANNDVRADGWNFPATNEQLLEAFEHIDPKMKKLFTKAEDI